MRGLDSLAHSRCALACGVVAHDYHVNTVHAHLAKCTCLRGRERFDYICVLNAGVCTPARVFVLNAGVRTPARMFVLNAGVRTPARIMA